MLIVVLHRWQRPLLFLFPKTFIFTVVFLAVQVHDSNFTIPSAVVLLVTISQHLLLEGTSNFLSREAIEGKSSKGTPFHHWWYTTLVINIHIHKYKNKNTNTNTKIQMQKIHIQKIQIQKIQIQRIQIQKIQIQIQKMQIWKI